MPGVPSQQLLHWPSHSDLSPRHSSWREQNLQGQHPHDNVQLITGVDFIGSTVGLAKVSALCSRHSGAVNQDHSKNSIGVASTMAHELGHNLGMSHDEDIPGCYCPEPREGGGCIMTESIGFFRVGSTVHLIEPLDADEEGQHAMYQAKHLQQKAGTCGVKDTNLNDLGPRALEIYRAQPRNWLIPRETRYVESYVVADSQEFQKLGSREAVRQRVLEVVNHVDKLYQELSFRVVLVGLEIWNKDKFYICRHLRIETD